VLVQKAVEDPGPRGLTTTGGHVRFQPQKQGVRVVRAYVINETTRPFSKYQDESGYQKSHDCNYGGKKENTLPQQKMSVNKSGVKWSLPPERGSDLSTEKVGVSQGPTLGETP